MKAKIQDKEGIPRAPSDFATKGGQRRVIDCSVLFIFVYCDRIFMLFRDWCFIYFLLTVIDMIVIA